MVYPRIASFKTHSEFVSRLTELGIDLPSDPKLEVGAASPLAAPLRVGETTIGNRFCILPMEGWDGTSDGKPTELTRRRWRHFGISGAKLIWGGEAVAVRHDGRANPHQLLLSDATLGEIESLRSELVGAHHGRFETTDDLFIGLQLTHSGRYARPNDKDRPEPRAVQRNRYLDSRMNLSSDAAILSDDDLRQLIDDFVSAATRTQKAGFDFVDIKHCHGYLGHELLSGFDRPGPFGGSFENRTRFLRDVAAGIRAAAPGLEVAVRISIFDFLPFVANKDGVGVADSNADPKLIFGGDGSGIGIDLDEPSRMMELLDELGIRFICTTAGSPYYNPHIQRPAYFPPSDGYLPPEDPLVGVARQINATAELKQRHPNLVFVGSGYSYLQEWLPHTAQAVVRRNWSDVVGLGRMVLSYPELPSDVLAGTTMTRKRICRTFSDCTTAPRHGLASGCYPLDPFYKERPERVALNERKQDAGR